MSWEPPSTVPTCSHGSPLNEFCVNCDGVKIETEWQAYKVKSPGDSESDCEVPILPVLKDSGERTTFSTGAQRDRQFGKGRPSLVPNWVIWLVSRVYEDGAKKYADRNWEKGMELSQYIDSAERHLAKLKLGLRDEPHATQVLWNIIGYIFTATLIKIGKRPKELNDMPDQLNSDPAAIAEPLSPYEYGSLQDFFGVKFDMGEVGKK